MNPRVLFQVFYLVITNNHIGRPFTREMIITEKLSSENAYATIDGAGRELPEVKQLTGLQLRYLPPGATMPTKGDKKEKVEKKSKKEKVSKKKSK